MSLDNVNELTEGPVEKGYGHLNDHTIIHASLKEVKAALDGRLSESDLDDRRLAPQIELRPEIREFYKQTSNRRNEPVVGVILGASSFEGSQATADHQMSIVLEKMFQSSFNPIGISGGYTVKIRNGGAWVKTGDTGEILDKDTRKLATLAPGATATHITFQPSTGIDIFYPEGPGCGAFTVQIDDGVPFTVTPSATAAYNKVWKSPVLERKIHTYKITAVADCQVGISYIRDQDENVGYRLYNFSRAGASTMQYLDASADSQSTWTRLSSIKPDFVVLGLSHNNITYTTVAQFVIDLETIVQKIKALDPTKKVWILCIGQHSTDVRYLPYKAALMDFAAANPNCTGIDYGQYFANTVEAAALTGEFHTDNLHLNSVGHEIAAHIIADQIGLPSRRTYPVIPPAPENINWDWKVDSSLVADYNAFTLPGAIGDRVPEISSARGSVTAPLAQTTVSKQPMIIAGPNGLKAVSGLASEQRSMSVSYSAKSTPFTVVGVWRRQTGSLRLASGVSTNSLTIQISGVQWRLDSSQAPAGYAPYTSSTSWFIGGFVYDGANTRIFIGSRTPTAITGMSNNIVTTDGFSIFRSFGDTAWTDGDFGRAILFSKPLSTFEMGRVIDTLAAETGIAVTS